MCRIMASPRKMGLHGAPAAWSCRQLVSGLELSWMSCDAAAVFGKAAYHFLGLSAAPYILQSCLPALRRLKTKKNAQPPRALCSIVFQECPFGSINRVFHKLPAGWSNTCLCALVLHVGLFGRFVLALDVTLNELCSSKTGLGPSKTGLGPT